MPGNTPDFGWADPDAAAVIEWSTIPTTEAVTMEVGTTESPITGPFDEGLLGERVAGGCVYKADRLVGRFRAELANGNAATLALQPPDCSMILVAEGQHVADGRVFVGRHDPVDPRFVRFSEPVALLSPHNYLLYVTLVTVESDLVGPRVFALPVQ